MGREHVSRCATAGALAGTRQWFLIELSVLGHETGCAGAGEASIIEGVTARVHTCPAVSAQ